MLEKLKPLNDRILVRREELTEDKTAGGIIIPDATKEKPQIGEVLAFGRGRMTNDGKILPVAIKAGEKVFFSKYSGVEVSDSLIVLREDEVIGILE